LVRTRGRDEVDVYECKWKPDEFDARALTVFRGYYPKGSNYLLTPLTGRSYVKRAKEMELKVCGLDQLDLN